MEEEAAHPTHCLDLGRWALSLPLNLNCHSGSPCLEPALWALERAAPSPHSHQTGSPRTSRACR